MGEKNTYSNDTMDLLRADHLAKEDFVSDVRRMTTILAALVLVLSPALLTGCTLPGAAGQEPEALDPEPATMDPPNVPEEVPPPVPWVMMTPGDVRPGDPIFVYVHGVAPRQDVVVHILDTTVDSHPQGEGRLAVVPVSYHVTPGEYPMRIEVVCGDEVAHEMEETLTVIDRQFVEQRLQVTEQLAARRSSDLWAEDRPHMERARAETRPAALWTEDFIMPTQGKISTEFGVIRYINDVESGRHSGIDIAAPTGTPVLAMNTGVVTLSMELNVTGKTIIVDHGLNLFSVYYHLSRLSVEEGEWVTRGQQIGDVGSTGFSTGPHLHLTVSVGRVPVDPWLFIDGDPLQQIRTAASRLYHVR